LLPVLRSATGGFNKIINYNAELTKGGSMRLMTRITIFALLFIFVFGAAYAQVANPKDAIKYRKSVMFLILQHFTAMGAVVQGKAAYDKNEFSVNAEAVSKLATLPLEAVLVPGSDEGDTTMTSAAFEKPDQFKKALESFASETSMLASVANTGDINTIKAQLGKVAQSCGACHKQFRNK
jgi:cytochrome c556